MARLHRIGACLWFDSQAEEAAKFYVSIFKNSKVGAIARYGTAGFEIHGRPAGSVMTVDFVLDGTKFTALNGGPRFRFSEAISFIVTCRDQREIDYYWRRLTAGGGQEGPCGWLTDRFGLSWQVVPEGMDRILAPRKGQVPDEVMQAIFQMKKINLKAIQRAMKAHEVAAARPAGKAVRSRGR